MNVVIAHRNRNEQLEICLKYFLERSKGKALVVDTGSDIIPTSRDRVGVIYAPEPGPFCKARALNRGILESDDIVGILDADVIVPEGIDEIAEKARYYSKACLRIKKIFLSDMDYLLRGKRWHGGLDELLTYTLKQGPDRYFAWDDCQCQVQKGQPHGNSQFFIQKKHLLAIGGYDEGYVGYGMQDIDLNNRLMRYFGKNYIGYVDMSKPGISLPHTYAPDFKDPELMSANSKRFKDNQKKHWKLNYI